MRKASLHQPILSSVRQEVPINLWHRHSIFIRKAGMAIITLMIFAVCLCLLSETNGISRLNAHPSNFNANKNQSVMESQPNTRETFGQRIANMDAPKQTNQGDRDAIELSTLDAAMVNLGHPRQATRPGNERDREFRRWQRWVTENRLGAVRYALRKYLRSNPEDIDAWSLLVDCEHRAKRWRAVIRNLKKVASLTTDERKRQAMFMAAFIAQENDDNSTAAQIFKRYLRKDELPLPMKAEALVRLVYAYRKIGLKEESEEMWHSILENYASAPLSQQGRKMFVELSNQLNKPTSEN